MADLDEGQQLAAQMQLANDLLDTGGLAGPALDHLRRWLRLDDTVTTCAAVSPSLALTRGYLLDRVCRTLAEQHPAEQRQAVLDYYRYDLIDTAPDDLSGLTQ